MHETCNNCQKAGPAMVSAEGRLICLNCGAVVPRRGYGEPDAAEQEKTGLPLARFFIAREKTAETTHAADA